MRSRPIVNSASSASCFRRGTTRFRPKVPCCTAVTPLSAQLYPLHAAVYSFSGNIVRDALLPSCSTARCPIGCAAVRIPNRKIFGQGLLSTVLPDSMNYSACRCLNVWLNGRDRKERRLAMVSSMSMRSRETATLRWDHTPFEMNYEKFAVHDEYWNRPAVHAGIFCACSAPLYKTCCASYSY